MIEKNLHISREVKIETQDAVLNGYLHIPPFAKGIVLFAHGSGSSRHSPRNQFVAHFLAEENVAALLFDLLTAEEEKVDMATREIRFNIPFLAERLKSASEWLDSCSDAHALSLGYFGASTGAAASLIAASELGPKVRAVVSRGGRPDLAGHALVKVQAPTLLIVGGDDVGVIELNQQAFELLNCKKKLEIIPHATHLFEERGALEEVARMAAIWFKQYL